VTHQQRKARLRQLDELIAGAHAELPSLYVRSYLPHLCPAPEVEAWLHEKIAAWEAELDELQAGFEHGWECPCAGCYFARLALEFRIGAVAP
jgi:hypothetical protein